MSLNFIIWEPGRHSWNAVMVLAAILFSPVILALLIVAFLIQAMVWPFSKLFPPEPSTASDMVTWLDVVIGSRDTHEDFEAAFDRLVSVKFDKPDLVSMQVRIKELGKKLDDPPWSAEVIPELKTMHESAQALVGDRT